MNSADERVKGFEGELKQVLDKAVRGEVSMMVIPQEKSPMKGYKK